CTFPDNGTYTVRGRIIDKDGGFSEYTTNVVVINVAPSLSGQTDQSSDEGASHSFSLGSFGDPGADSPWTVSINWGDGHVEPLPNASSPGSLGSASHTYDDNGSYTATVTEIGKAAGWGQAQFTVTVANVAPTADLANDGPVDEGSPATISFSN